MAQVSLVQALIGIMVAVLIGIVAVVPTITSAVSSANLTGTNLLLAGLLSTFVIIALVLAVTRMF